MNREKIPKECKFCKTCEHLYYHKCFNGWEYPWCRLLDRSVGKVWEDLRIILYDLEVKK